MITKTPTRCLQQCHWFGFKHIIFEDNYPAGRGDCYSLKKAFAHAGFGPTHAQQRVSHNGLLWKAFRKLAMLAGIGPIAFVPQYTRIRIAPNNIDARLLQKHLEVYAEFPPVFKPEKRSGRRLE